MAGSPAAMQTAPHVKQFVSGLSEAEMPRRAHVEREGMNLVQAIAASSNHLAIRQVGDRRVIVDRGEEFLTVHIQRRSNSRWIADDNGGGVRYLAGVLRDGMGRYLSLCSSDGLYDIERIRTVLPLCSQALLLPECDDWQVIERGDL
jgi:hypothetical protein